MTIGKGGQEALSANRRTELLLEEPLSEAAEKILLSTIVESHCGMIDGAGAGPMLAVQRARDGAMARAMLDAGDDGAVLIAGSGHVRRDYGVPRLLPENSAFVIGQFEADALSAVEAPAFDAVHLTEPVDRGDPCEPIRAMMKARARDTEGGDSK